MLTRRYGVVAAIAIGLIALAAMTVRAAPGADAGRETSSDASRVWLTLDWTGGMPPAGEHLTVYADGRVRLVLESPRANGYIGTFELSLPKARFAELQQAVKAADLRGMKDEYGPWHLEHDYTHVTIAVNEELGTKQVRAHSASLWYPRPLRRLFDLSNDTHGPYPGGILSKLIDEVSAKPIAAVGARVDAPKRSYRLGDGIDVAVLVKNVGREVVVLPSMESKAIVTGYIGVKLHQETLPPEKIATGWDMTDVEFGPRLLEWHRTLDDEAKSDLRHAVRLEAGAEWRIPMPKPLHAPSAGTYELFCTFQLLRLYDREVLTREVGDGFVSGWMWPQSVEITVSK